MEHIWDEHTMFIQLSYPVSVLLLKRGIMKYVLQSPFQNFDNQYPPEKLKFFFKTQCV